MIRWMERFIKLTLIDLKAGHVSMVRDGVSPHHLFLQQSIAAMRQ